MCGLHASIHAASPPQVSRLRGEREQLRRELSDARGAAAGGGVGVGVSLGRGASCASAAGGAAGEGLQALMAEEAAIYAEASALKQAASSMGARPGA